ncbi:NIPSNAP family protein [Rathayibacter oskolensis]|uniref:NIPSNAP family protein n=1 Tax=Rathayibacter oskolensis TaxID=1891671 RepID=UPI00265E2466|nr:NIPSNAP family protein [Rathayibacter oskolensis]WKK71082.1 NIPSNAP family protein [Rathayibacter oskolensis]
MITIHLRYQIDPEQLDTFTEYGRRWIRLVNRLGGDHHGYFLPAEGDNDEAFALFSFPSLAAYEQYRRAAETDQECIDAYELVRGTGCIVRFERRFQKPLFGDAAVLGEPA